MFLIRKTINLGHSKCFLYERKCKEIMFMILIQCFIQQLNQVIRFIQVFVGKECLSCDGTVSHLRGKPNAVFQDSKFRWIKYASLRFSEIEPDLVLKIDLVVAQIWYCGTDSITVAYGKTVNAARGFEKKIHLRQFTPASVRHLFLKFGASE